MLDGNMEIVILCFAPVNTKNWSWFLRNLVRSTNDVENPVFPFIKDCRKGLKVVVRYVFHGKVHIYCAQHLRGDMKRKFGKIAKQFFLFYVYTHLQRE